MNAMINLEQNRDLKLQQVLEWAAAEDTVRAVLLTSSLVNPYAPVDRFSDLDIELVVTDLPLFLSDNGWIEGFGSIIAMVAEGEEVFDGKHAMRMVLYEDHTKIDFKIWAQEKFREEVQAAVMPEDWDVGYKVLIDKDELTTGMKAPAYTPVFIQRPSRETYNQVMNDLWWDMSYVAKCLWRDNLFYAKFMSENMMRTQYLEPLIEWYIGMQYDWQVSTNKRGRLFKQYLAPELWKRIEATFSGSDTDDNWRALQAYTEIGRELGLAIAAQLGYDYPHQLDERICAYLDDVKALPRDEGTFQPVVLRP